MAFKKDYRKKCPRCKNRFVEHCGALNSEVVAGKHRDMYVYKCMNSNCKLFFIEEL